MVAMLTAVAANYRYGEALQHPLAFHPSSSYEKMQREGRRKNFMPLFQRNTAEKPRQNTGNYSNKFEWEGRAAQHRENVSTESAVA